MKVQLQGELEGIPRQMSAAAFAKRGRIYCTASLTSIAVSNHRYVKTSDGTRREFKVGDILFQDNTKDSPAAKEPHHFSGTVGEGPCQQVIVQMSRKPEVDNPGPL